MILRRIEGSRFSEVAPLWAGATVVILGGGPSLTGEQVALVRWVHDAGSVRAIAVNDAYLLAPWADVHYAADVHWHRWHAQGIARPGFTADQVRERWMGFPGQKCSIESADSGGLPEHIHLLRNRDHPNLGLGLSSDPRALVTGFNSGFQALNLAVLAWPALVILLGFDGAAAQNGRTHWFGEHPKPTPAAAYELYRRAMSAAENALIEAGVQVLNCSPGSSIDSFPRARLEDLL